MKDEGQSRVYDVKWVTVHIQSWPTSCCSQWPKAILVASFLKVSESGNKLTQRKKNTKNYAFLLISSESHLAAIFPESSSFPQTSLRTWSSLNSSPPMFLHIHSPCNHWPISWFLHLHYPVITLLSVKRNAGKLISPKVQEGKGHRTPASVVLPLSRDHIEQQLPSPFVHIRVRSEVPQTYNKVPKVTHKSTVSVCSIG